jgi:hypothetical protein
MPDYQLAKIYKIVCNITNECDIGSTCEPILARRLAGHVAKYKCYLKGKCNNTTSYKIIANGNYNIVLIELFPCDSKDQLHARESHYTQTIQCVNMIKNQGLLNALGKMEYKKQYYVDHKDQHKQYREEHKEQKKQYNVYNRDHIADKTKQYREQHKDHLAKQKKLYNKANIEKIKHYKNTVIYCQCGCSYTRHHKSRHERSKKHQEYVDNRLYYDIRRGLNMIKKLDAFFKKK